MLTAFLITTLLFFVFSLGLQLITIGVGISNPEIKLAPTIIGVFLMLIMITWNIIMLVSL